MERNNFSDKLWRLVKVLYFLFTVPATIVLYIIVSENFWIKKYYGSGRQDYYSVGNYYDYFFYGLLIITCYLIVTDVLLRVSCYIGNGVGKGRIPYKSILKKFRYVVVLGLLSMIGLFVLGNIFTDKIKSYCSEKGAVLKWDKSCTCIRGYDYINNKCVIKPEEFLRETLEEKIQDYVILTPNEIAKEVRVIDFEMIDENYGIALAVKIEDVVVPPNEDLSGDSYGRDCYSSVEGLGSVTGKASVFTFIKHGNDIKIIKVNSIPTWSDNYYGDVSLTYPIFNTKQENYNRYGGEKPISESDGNRLERTKIINFRDIDGDGEALEFFLINHYDLMCGLDNYRIIGFDKERKTPILYDFADNKGILKGWTELSWGSENSFTGGKIKQERICGSNVAGGYDESWEYVFNSEKKVFETKNYKSRKCREDEF